MSVVLAATLSGCFSSGAGKRSSEVNYLGRAIDEPEEIPGPFIPDTPVEIRNDGLVLYPLTYPDRGTKFDPTTFRGFIFKGVMKARLLHQRYDEGQFLLLNKSDFWEVRPQDWTVAWGWGYQDRIEIFESPDTKFPYGFYNTETGVAINVRFLGVN